LPARPLPVEWAEKVKVKVKVKALAQAAQQL
jgi:hypothetical protein